MRKIYILAVAALAVIGCSKQWNDLVHEEVVAEVTEFGIENQAKCTILKSQRKVAVVMPEGTDLAKLKIAEFKLTEGAVCDPALKIGDEINLSEPLTITLTTYDPYVWTLSAEVEIKPEPGPEPEPKTGPQLYNMSFDHWCKDGDVDFPYDADATEEEKAVWGSANSTTGKMGMPTVMAEKEFLAVSGEGKAALKLKTEGIDFIIKILAAGSIFNGYPGEINFATFSADIFWGIPFNDRPKTLEGYACYQPKTIDFTKEPYQDLEGQTDKGHIFVLLTDWNEPFKVSPPASLVDFDNDPAIIGYGKVVFSEDDKEYKPFSLKIDYRSERTPKYVAIVAASSALGDYFTGAKGSVLYLDELSFTY